MKRIFYNISLVLIACLFFTTTMPAAALNKSIIPEDTQWIVHMDMEMFNKTQFKELLMKERDAMHWKWDNHDLIKEFNINPHKDIYSVTAFGNQKDHHNMVFMCKGNFNQKLIMRELNEDLKLKEWKYNKFTVHQWRKNHYGVFVGKDLVIYSRDEATIKNVLDVIRGKKKNLKSAPLMNYVKMIPTNAFMLAASNDLSALGGKHGPQGMILGKTGVATFMALEQNKNLTMEVMLDSGTEENAKNVENIIRGLTALANMHQNDQSKKYMKLIKSLNISRKGNTLHLIFSHPSEALIQMIKSRRHSFSIGDRDHKKHKKHH
jgi:hypothetical protein